VLGALAAAAALLVARGAPRTRQVLDEPGAEAVRGPRIALRLPETLAPRAADVRSAAGAARKVVGDHTGVPIPPLAIAVDREVAGEREAVLALDGTPVAWLALGDDPVAGLRDQLPGALAQLVPELISVDRTAALLEGIAAQAPVLVREVVPRVVTIPVLAEILRHLAREQVPLADLAAILEAIALAPLPARGVVAADVPALVEHVRGQLRRQISARWAPRGQLAVFTVDAMIEDAVRTAIDRRDGGQILALEPAIAQDIVAAVRGTVARGAGVLLVSADVRRHLRHLLEPELPGIAILAAHELAPGTAITTAGRITV
jgi:type III secretory pathway component EscV